MTSDDESKPWLQPLFAPDTPLEVILRIAHVFCDQPYSEEPISPEQDALDVSIGQKLAVECFRHGADYRRVPWILRLEHVRLTGIPEGSPSKPRKAPETE